MYWISFDARTKQEAFFAFAGKALFLCQHFEALCKDIVMWLCLSKALHEKQFEFLSDEHKAAVDRLLGLFLGRSIVELNAIFGGKFQTESINTLRQAKDARNYLCHELELPLVFARSGSDCDFVPDLKHYQERVRKLAHGDYLVSRWSCEFHEKELGYFINRKAYVDHLVRWVLRGFGDRPHSSRTEARED